MSDIDRVDKNEGEAYENHRRYVETTATARVEVKARIIARANGEDPNSLPIDAWGPVWERYIGQALEEIESEKAVGENCEKIEVECRKMLDKEIIELLWEKAPGSYTILFVNAAKRLAVLSRENEYLKSNLDEIMKYRRV